MDKRYVIFGTLLPLLLTAAGCSDQKNGSPAAADAKSEPAPVTLNAQLSAAYKEVFTKYMEPVIKAKLPYITLQYLDEKPTLEERIASGDIPDLLLPNGNLRPIIDVNLQYDLTEMIKTYKFDLSKLDPTLIDSIKAYGPKGEIYALPGDRSVKILLYNKDLFNKFNAPYPKDGMSWEDIIALARKLTRTENGVSYYGLNPAGYGNLKSQLQLPVFGKDDKPQLSTPDWQKLAATWKAIYEIPGNRTTANARDLFSKNQNTAMLLNNSSWLLRNPVAGLDWDYVVAPTFDNKLVPDLLGSMLSIAATSKNKDAAFQVIALYYSDEVQSAIARDAALVVGSSLPEIQKLYGTNTASSTGKNVQADFSGKAAVKVIEPYDYVASPILNQAFNDIADGKKDINTALREAEEQINLKVQEEKTKKQK
ncbi:ABC transporter substrate-binding protein [Paenibacillus ginsengarvi]|uniref:ABC transporter substrate-binding protein n=1 Tax=Paenibacillus ginsengarvi TaxID=400777 RepID=UPI00131556DA|nr:extracellular solute-binding protein [Paenibacillus ginsengarvi]